MVEFQASSMSGIDITPATDMPLLSPTKKAFTLACASGCGNAQTSAEAVAQSSACAWMASTKGCNAVRVALTGQNYAQAFIKSTAAAWSNACSLGYGRATSTGTAQAKSTADVLSRAFGEVVAAACSNCDTCKCKPLPPGWTYDKSDDISKAAATSVAGQFTMAKAISQAVGAYCDSDKSAKALQAGVNATMNTMAVILANVMAKTTADASAQGVAMSCAGGYVSQQIKASKVAFINALTDASAVVFNHQCAAAHSRMKTMANALSDSIDESFESISSKCAKAAAAAEPVAVNAEDIVKKTLTHNKPVVASIAEAFQDAVSCGCKPGNCFWCVANEANKTLSASSVSAFDLGNNVTGQFQAPLNWNQMAGIGMAGDSSSSSSSSGIGGGISNGSSGNSSSTASSNSSSSTAGAADTGSSTPGSGGSSNSSSSSSSI
uniref:Uncharacterized protein n=1 Tax=Tetradesmus obliquus TaxID=3088 RepID=A0A383VXF1_TETOB|eukprot:jgi/Sobl393_1/12393/SZX69871.1